MDLSKPRTKPPNNSRKKCVAARASRFLRSAKKSLRVIHSQFMARVVVIFLVFYNNCNIRDPFLCRARSKLLYLVYYLLCHFISQSQNQKDPLNSKSVKKIFQPTQTANPYVKTRQRSRGDFASYRLGFFAIHRLCLFCGI